MAHIVVSLGLLALAIAVYVRHRTEMGGWLMPALRLGVVLLLGLMLAASIITRIWTVRPRTVLILADGSQSMRAVGADTTASRLARTLPLPDGCSRSVWLFGRTIVRGATGPLPESAADRTVLAQALSEAGATNPRAVVLLSDGQDNGPDDPAAVAQRLRAPVYAVGLGRSMGIDLSMHSVEIPATVTAGETARVRVRVEAHGAVDETIAVRLAGHEQSLSLSGEGLYELVVPVVFRRPGIQSVSASVDSFPGEDDIANNSLNTAVFVRSARVSVVYVTSHASPNTRFVLAALARNPRVRTHAFTDLRSGWSGLVQALDTADVVLLDDVAEGDAPAQAWAALGNRARAGAGVMLLAGVGTQMGPALSSLFRGSAGPVQSGTFAVDPAALGRHLTGFGDSEAGPATELPPLPGFRAAPQGPADAIASSGGQALVTLSKPGSAGRLMYVGVFPLWHWGLRPGGPVAASPLDRLLSSSVNLLTSGAVRPFRLDPVRPGFHSGDDAVLRLVALRPDGSPWPGLFVSARAWAGSDSSRAVRAPGTEGSPGVYTIRFSGLSAGDYAVQATAAGRDSVVGATTGTFCVLAQPVEVARLGLRADRLRAIAEAGHGEYIPAESLGVRGLNLRTSTLTRMFRWDVRHSPVAYALAALLAGIEWLLRRKRGML